MTDEPGSAAASAKTKLNKMATPRQRPCIFAGKFVRLVSALTLNLGAPASRRRVLPPIGRRDAGAPRFMASMHAGFSAHWDHEPFCASPSPLNGERIPRNKDFA